MAWLISWEKQMETESRRQARVEIGFIMDGILGFYDKRP